MVIACADWFDALARLAGWIAHLAAVGIVESARLVDVAPWLVRRVPAPPALIVITYYSGLAVTLVCRRRLARTCGAACAVIAGVLIITGVNPLVLRADPSSLRLTMLDVGQGDAMVLQIPAAAGREVPLLFPRDVGRPFTGRHTV